MKIAIISDIHANLHALKSVLVDIQNKKCDKIFCLGDLVLAGSQPRETIDFIMSQPWSKTTIQGNTDEMIAHYNNEVFEKTYQFNPVMGNALKDDVSILNEEEKVFLKNLPKTLEYTEEGVKILLTHGSPRANNENILNTLSIDEVEEILANTDADITFCGHTHIPCGYQTNSGQLLVNVGSVGRPMTSDKMPCYVLLEIINGEVKLEHILVDYDRKSAKELIKNREFQLCDKLSEML